MDCDLCNYSQTLDYFNTHKPDYVVHLVANVGGLSNTIEWFENNYDKIRK